MSSESPTGPGRKGPLNLVVLEHDRKLRLSTEFAWAVDISCRPGPGGSVLQLVPKRRDGAESTLGSTFVCVVPTHPFT